MSIYNTIKNKRTIRIFKNKKIDYKILKKCINAARLSSSARNSQPLVYIIVDDENVLKKIVPYIRFGGFISRDKMPRKGSEPKAAIVIIVKKGYEDYYQYDVGIASQNIALVAYENKIGCCMIANIDKKRLKKELSVPDEFFVDLIIALGYPAENPRIIETDSDIVYYRKKDRLYIPKRKLQNILHRNKF